MIAVVDSGGANVASVLFALERLGIKSAFTADPNVITKASHVIFPGVGAAATAMRTLRDKELIDCLRSLRQPVLGICLGMQLLFTHSQEGDTNCLDIISGEVKKFSPSVGTVPHTGWNQVAQNQKSLLFKDIPDYSFFYFVHSFYVPQHKASLGLTDYGIPFTSSVNQDNFFGCQFHPERSGAQGAKLIENFTRL